MNLYLFPESANNSNGYRIAVDADYCRLSPCREVGDIVVWYSNDKNLIISKVADIVINRPSLISIKRLKNMFINRLGSELLLSELNFLANMEFDNIFCGDVVFYRALKKIYPKKKIQVRFHNCFSRIYERKKMLNIHCGLKFNLILWAAKRLENEIFFDRNAEKYFISDEDMTYYQLMTGAIDASVWNIPIDKDKMLNNRDICRYNNRIVWLGGIEAHKEKSIKWFIKSIFPSIRQQIPEVEFHLWGNHTQNYNDIKNCIFGHGFYEGEDIPFSKQGLYINPDIIGGGVKIKLKTYFEEGATFISTPFGFEGYSKELIDNKYCFVIEPALWSAKIVELLTNNK